MSSHGGPAAEGKYNGSRRDGDSFFCTRSPKLGVDPDLQFAQHRKVAEAAPKAQAEAAHRVAEAADLQAGAANPNLRPKQPTPASRSRALEGVALRCEAARVDLRHHCANDWDRYGVPQHRPDLAPPTELPSPGSPAAGPRVLAQGPPWAPRKRPGDVDPGEQSTSCAGTPSANTFA